MTERMSLYPGFQSEPEVLRATDLCLDAAIRLELPEQQWRMLSGLLINVVAQITHQSVI